MATLELQFNCLCLFVPDPVERVVHILMPATNGHAGHAGHRHVVRMLHHSFEGTQKLEGRPMEGWALVLGPEQASADHTLVPSLSTSQGRLPNLSDITGNRIDPALVGPNPGNRVAARITLRSGRITHLASEATWEIGGTDIPLANRVTWQMDRDSALRWEPLNGRALADAKPLETLKDLEPEDDLGYKLRIFHVTEEALPPRGGTLRPEVMREHYRAFYPLLDVNAPGNNLLPRFREKPIFQITCGGARADLGTPGG